MISVSEPSHRGRPLQRSPYLVFGLCMLVNLGVLIFRDPHALTAPVMHCEDGRDIFPFYYSLAPTVGGLIHGLLRFYDGYMGLASNIVGWIASRFPTLWQAHLLVVIPMCVSAAGFGAFSLPVFRKFVESDAQRALICIGLGLLPLGNFAKIGATGYIQWPIAIVLSMFLLSEAPPRLDRAGGVLRCMGLAVLIWSVPFSVILIPLFVYEATRRRAAGWPVVGGQLVLGAAAALYAVLGRDRALAANTIDAPSAAWGWLRAIPERVIFESAVGNEARLALLGGGHQGVLDVTGVIIGVLILLALWNRMRANADFRRFVWKIAYMVAGYTALCVAFRTVDLATPWARRYTYTQSALVGLLLLIAVTDLLLDRGVRARTFRRVVGTFMVMAWLGYLNMLNNRYYQVSAADGARIREFVRSVRTAEQIGARSELMLDRGGWSIRVVVQPKT